MITIAIYTPLQFPERNVAVSGLFYADEHCSLLIGIANITEQRLPAVRDVDCHGVKDEHHTMSSLDDFALQWKLLHELCHDR